MNKLKNIFLKITASAAMLIGIIAAVTGTRALMGLFDPGYSTFTLLILYNILMGFVSVLAGSLIWRRHKLAIKISGLITVAHFTVLLSLLSIFNDIIAPQSVNAMTFRSVFWIAIFVVVYTINRSQKSGT